MEDDVVCGFMNKAVHEEIMPTLSLPREELESFAFAVTERFKNPFIDHALLSICLNSTSKWKARVLLVESLCGPDGGTAGCALQPPLPFIWHFTE